MKKKLVWIDTDLSVGMKRHQRDGYSDVDDGYAVLQLLYAKNIDIKGISTVFGNTNIENAFKIGQFISSRFAENRIPVFKGAGAGINLKNVGTNEAVEALATALKKEPLIILAIGPATNIGILLLKYPELKSQIIEIVLVAGRRKPTDYFKIGTKGNHAQDLNFDMDNDAFRILFENQLPVVLCPFEISNKVWLTETDLDALRNGMPGNEWLAAASQKWLEQWLHEGANGFNPFDVLASHYIMAPQDIVSEPLNARLEIHLDDTAKENTNRSFKSFLLCDKSPGFPVIYCYDVEPNYHNRLLKSLKA